VICSPSKANEDSHRNSAVRSAHNMASCASESDSLPVSSAVQSTKVLRAREPIQTLSTEKWRSSKHLYALSASMHYAPLCTTFGLHTSSTPPSIFLDLAPEMCNQGALFVKKTLKTTTLLYLLPTWCNAMALRWWENVKHPFRIFTTHFLEPPKTIVYDNACKLRIYTLNGEPELCIKKQ